MRTEIARFEASARAAEEKLTRFDLAGMSAGAEEANELVRLRSFSWSRFLTRLEKTLPYDVRVVLHHPFQGDGEEEDGRAGTPGR